MENTTQNSFIPSGSYQLTCKNIQVMLECQAQTNSGNYIPASLNLTQLINPDVWNNNGVLQLANDTQPQNGFLPGGSWTLTCTDINVTLSCQAQQQNGQWVPATFNLTNLTPQTTDLWNNNGILQNAS